jgi:hypothetical protein
MISGKQLKQVLDYSFTAGSGFLAPTATFIATPSTYTTSSLPASVVLTGDITLNDAASVTWTITDASGTVLTSGSGVSVSHTLATVPSALSTNLYNLNVTYTNTVTAASQVLVVPTSVIVTAPCLIGQLATGVDITVAADLTPAIETTLTVSNQATIINVFDIVASELPNGKIIFVIPDSYGSVTSIEDGAGLNVISQFNAVVDGTNGRTIYTAVTAVTPATYNYKIIF